MLPLAATQLVAKLLVALATLLVGAAAFRVFRWLRAHWLLSALPQPADARGPLGGVVQMLRADHHRYLTRCSEELGGLFYLRVATLQMVIVADPELAAGLLQVGRDTGLDKATDLLSVFNQVTNDQDLPSIFTSPTNEYWRAVRKGIAPAFATMNIRHSCPDVVATAQQLVRALGSVGPHRAIDVDDAMLRQTYDVIGKVGFKRDWGSTRTLLEGTKPPMFELLCTSLAEKHRELMNPLRKRMFWDQGRQEGVRATVGFRRLLAELVAECKAEAPFPESDVSILAHIFRLRDPATGQPLSDAQLAAEVGTLLVAGFDTTAHSLAWSLYLLSQHPEAEARAVAELAGLGLLAQPGKAGPRALEWADLAKMPYLTGIMHETMRVYPVAADGTTRLAQRDIQLRGVTVPAGTHIFVPFHGLHHNSRAWDRVDEFLPERWEDPEAAYALSAAAKGGPAGAAASDDGASAPSGKLRPRRFAPFSDGARNCVGQSLARLDFLATLAVLLGHFHFRLADQMGGAEGVRAREGMALTMQPMGGLWMHCEPRDPAMFAPAAVAATPEALRREA